MQAGQPTPDFEDSPAGVLSWVGYWLARIGWLLEALDWIATVLRARGPILRAFFNLRKALALVVLERALANMQWAPQAWTPNYLRLAQKRPSGKLRAAIGSALRRTLRGTGRDLRSQFEALMYVFNNLDRFVARIIRRLQRGVIRTQRAVFELPANDRAPINAFANACASALDTS